MVISNENFRKHPNGKIYIPAEDYYIWEAYGFKCVICREWAVCLHENPPKSLNSDWREHPEDRYPVCNLHHENLHETGRTSGKALLDKQRELYFPHALERIKNVKRK